MKFVKRPIEIEARQFTEQDKNTVYHWASEIQQNVQPSTDQSGNPVLLIPTLEGDMICSLGDWIIVEPFPTDWRKLYLCKPEIFAATYAPAAHWPGGPYPVEKPPPRPVIPNNMAPIYVTEGATNPEPRRKP